MQALSAVHQKLAAGLVFCPDGRRFSVFSINFFASRPHRKEFILSLSLRSAVSPLGRVTFYRDKSNQKALARFRSKARLKICRPRRKRNSRVASVAALKHPFRSSHD
jgi:hypothetical protein